MAEIKTRPATPEYRDNWDRIFARVARPVTIDEWRGPEYVGSIPVAALADEFHEKTYESAHA